MPSSIFNVGLSGLFAAQAGLDAASHNIANVSTPGFSRQQVLLGTANPKFTGAGYIGQGVSVDTVRRVYDEFLTTRVQQMQAGTTELSTKAADAARLDAIFSDPTTGLSPALSEFFAGLNQVAAQPNDISSRQVFLTAAQSLAGRMNELGGQLDEVRDGVDAQIRSATGEINAAAESIARLNQEIALAVLGDDGTHPPNDLLDQRDALLAELNKQVGATAVAQSDGSINVYLGHGTPLVVGVIANKLTPQPGNDDPLNLEIGFTSNGTTMTMRTSDLTGGILGGALRFREEVLDPAADRLGGIAIAVASAINAQHELGQDLNGQLGGALFASPSPLVQNALSNTGNALVDVDIASAVALTGSNYKLSYDGSAYTLTRLSDNTSQTFATLPQTVDGLSIAIGSGAFAAGDSFLIQPAREAASQMSVAITDVRKIAAAAPIRTSFALSNAGSGAISAGSVDAAYPGSPLGSPVTLTFSGGNFTGFPATQAVTVTVGTTSATYAAGSPVPYTPGATMTFGGISIAVSGTPANGDTFTVSPNTGGTADARNALLLGAIANLAGTVNGNASLSQANGALITFVGTATHQAQQEADMSNTLLTQAIEAQQSVSGVNLDEEAANLQRYQQQYQAAAKVMAIAASLFDSILAIAD